MDIRGIGCKVMGWIRLARDMDKWQSLVNTVLTLRDS